MASIAIGRGGAARNSSLKISSEIGPTYPDASTLRTKRVTGMPPWPGKSRKWRLHDSGSSWIIGASAICTKNIRSLGILAMGASSSRMHSV